MIEVPRQIDTNYGKKALSEFRTLMYRARIFADTKCEEWQEIINNEFILEKAAQMISSPGDDIWNWVSDSEPIRTQFTKMLADKLVEKNNYMRALELYEQMGDIEGIRAMINNGSYDTNGVLNYDLILASWRYGNQQQKKGALNDFCKVFAYDESTYSWNGVDSFVQDTKEKIQEVHKLMLPGKVYKFKGGVQFYNMLANLVRENRYDGYVPVMNSSNIPGIVLRAIGAQVRMIEYHREWGDVEAEWMPVDNILNAELPQRGNILIVENDYASGRTIDKVVEQIGNLVPKSIDVLTTGYLNPIETKQEHPSVRKYRLAKDLPKDDRVYDNMQWVKKSLDDLLRKVQSSL